MQIKCELCSSGAVKFTFDNLDTYICNKFTIWGIGETTVHEFQLNMANGMSCI